MVQILLQIIPDKLSAAYVCSKLQAHSMQAQRYLSYFVVLGLGYMRTNTQFLFVRIRNYI